MILESSISLPLCIGTAAHFRTMLISEMLHSKSENGILRHEMLSRSTILTEETKRVSFVALA